MVLNDFIPNPEDEAARSTHLGKWSTDKRAKRAHNLARRLTQIVKETNERGDPTWGRRKYLIARNSMESRTRPCFARRHRIPEGSVCCSRNLGTCVFLSTSCTPTEECKEKPAVVQIFPMHQGRDAPISSRSSEREGETHQTHMYHTAEKQRSV